MSKTGNNVKNLKNINLTLSTFKCHLNLLLLILAHSACLKFLIKIRHTNPVTNIKL